MRQLLHIVTKPKDDLAKAIIDKEQNLPNTKVDVVDLSKSKTNYDQLVEKIFAADSIQVW